MGIKGKKPPGSRERIAEEMVELRTSELARANSELSLFASFVAHELHEPLRKIVEFGDLLDSGVPEGEAAAYRSKMQEAARRMQRLVDNILTLTRVTSRAQPLESVDLGAVLAEVAADYKDQGGLEVSPLPTVRGDPLQLRHLFGNLVSNAFKFRRKDEAPRIAVATGEERGGFIEVLVSDNGIGFEAQHRERIFKPFQRLHRRGEYDGSGMGLAICERIMLRHGGAISAQSEPGKGSVFTVAFPTL